MLATTPPTENPIALRVAILDLTRHRLEPLFDAGELDALPAWLWSLPAHHLARHLDHAPAALAARLADSLEAETARRHPCERFAAYLDQHSPHLSRTQRGRLAEFAAAFVEARDRNQEGAVSDLDMRNRGFSNSETWRLKDQAFKLIQAVEDETAPASDTPHNLSPADRLRLAGNRAHARRAFADGEIESCPLAASRPAATSSTTGAPR